MPNRFNPINSSQGTKAALNRLTKTSCKLDAEAFTKRRGKRWQQPNYVRQAAK